MLKRIFFTASAALAVLQGCRPDGHGHQYPEAERIVNIINFIRLCEPRYDGAINRDMLFETTQEQIGLMAQYGFRGTFLLQYDALIEPRYRELMESARAAGHEIGGWWEITQPHVERAGMEWRGRYPWDWHADVGFSTGYTPAERESLVDVYMEEFRSAFGNYPKAVGSWFIDAHTLAYMHEKYGIEASCNCKEQVGTDGYTLWGGYYPGAYYPSRVNAYMPAQNEAAQIPVPVFRMLGSDPIYQYDTGIGGSWQQVESLEPVYPHSGGDAEWIRYFFGSMADDPALGLTYAQVGQENSFTWPAMAEGLKEQFAVIDSLNTAKRIRVETLTESARRYREQYPVTAPTATSTLRDIRGEGHRTVWFNSRFYRVNMLWEDGAMRLRDIHMFDERLKSNYFEQAGTSTQCVYHTLPVMDGFNWSTTDKLAGVYLCERLDGGIRTIPCGDPVMEKTGSGEITVSWEIPGTAASFEMEIGEGGFTIKCTDETMDWFLSFRAPAITQGDEISLAADISGVSYVYKDFGYRILSIAGIPERSGSEDELYAINPAGGRIELDFSVR